VTYDEAIRLLKGLDVIHPAYDIGDIIAAVEAEHERLTSGCPLSAALCDDDDMSPVERICHIRELATS